MFAAQTREDGLVSACLFTEPEFIVDDTFLLDYSMFFGAALLDYYKASGDMKTLQDLSGCAYRQLELAKAQFDEKDLLQSGEGFWAFIGWTEGLDKQAAMTGGVQSNYGCGTTIKHFACNNQEDNRMGSDSIVSEKTIRELYLKGFEIAVKESQPLSIMTSYNLIDGVHAANNHDLCTDVARMGI